MTWLNGLALILIACSSCGLGWIAASLWIEWDTERAIAYGYDDGYAQGYQQAVLDGRLDSGQTQPGNTQDRSDPPF